MRRGRREFDKGNFMKRTILGLALASYLTCTAFAESVNTYQVTGPILELTATKIVVQKGDEKWEVARDGNTKVEGDLKVGAKVTIRYRMVAAKVEVKSTGATEKR